jgi:hypothetical protein
MFHTESIKGQTILQKFQNQKRMPSAVVDDNCEDFQFVENWERIDSSKFSDPDEDETTFQSADTTFVDSSGRVSDASLVANQKRVQNDNGWITIEQQSVISNLNLPIQYFPDWVPIDVRALLIDLQIYVELELQKVLKLPGFEKIKSCYTLVSFGTMSETCLLGRYESQYTLRGDTRKRHTSDRPGHYKIGDIIGPTPRFIENGIGRERFEDITFWVSLLLIVG